MSVKRTAAARGSGREQGGSSLGNWLLAALLVVGVANLVLLLRLGYKLEGAEHASSDLRDPDLIEQTTDAVPPSRDLESNLDAPGGGELEEAAGSVTETSEPAVDEEQDAGEQTTELQSSWQPVPEAERSGIRLQVLNSIGVPRLAARSGDWLQRLGYDIREKGNARNAVDKTLILQRRGSRHQAQRLAQDLGIGPDRIREEPDGRLVDVDLTLILGQDYAAVPPFKQD